MASRWMSYNSQSQERIEIDPKEMKAYIRAVPQAQVKNTYFWQASWNEWKPLASIPEFMKLREATTVKKSTAAATPPPPTNIHSVEKKKKAEAGGAERRQHVRYQTRLKVLITVDNVVFRTFSVDASRGGVRLEHPLPRGLIGETVEMYFYSANSKSGLRFKATLVPDAKEASRLSFLEPNPKTQDIFESWLRSLPGAAKKSA